MVTPEQRENNVKAFDDLIKVVSYDEGPVAPLTDWYSLALIQPTGGYWYFSFECPPCGRISPMFRDYSEGRLGNPFANYGFDAICYFCNAHIRCASENVRSAQWPLDPGQTPPESEYTKRPTRKIGRASCRERV